MQKKLWAFLSFCLFLSCFSFIAEAKASSLQKKDFSSNLPARPALSLKQKPERTALDFLEVDTKIISEDPFFQTTAFIGDSITQGLTLLEGFDSIPIMANLGLTLTKAKNNLEDWQTESIETLFILLGINDMTYYYMDTETYISLYDELITALRERFPDTLLVIQSILPVTHVYDHPRITNETISQFNQALEAFCEQEDLLFVNICEPFCLEDGSLNPDMSSDGLHLFYRHYGAWLAQLQYAVEYS